MPATTAGTHKNAMGLNEGWRVNVSRKPLLTFIMIYDINHKVSNNGYLISKNVASYILSS